MSSCCPSETPQADHCHPKKKFDFLLYGSGFFVISFYLLHLFSDSLSFLPSWSVLFAANSFHLMNKMWWGLAIGVIFVGFLSRVPREFVIAILGESKGLSGILRATAAGLLLDLCSHGILMVGVKLYERGASLGQVMAFLIASPWNSFSLTVILIALIGLKWTLIFILLSAVIAVLTGLIFNFLVGRGSLPANPHATSLPKGFRFWAEAKKSLSATRFDARFFLSTFVEGLKDSRMILRWLLFGVLLAVTIQVFLPTELFQTYFGPSLIGLLFTLGATTIIEVCSEGSSPIAADLLTRARAPGNSFTFLMAGVSTDYTEILVLRERTKSWKIALFLPLLTVPQIIALGYILNQFS